ncbi:MAG: capsular biosynthesis protein [Alistipes sp.]|nr:capsular biosynthesis protein [Alistipes sp.]
MWPFGNGKSAAAVTFGGFTDRHTHILPAVDDGVRSMEEALEILRIYEAAGMAEVWCTPHIMEDIPNTTSALRERFAELEDAYTGGMRLHLASENMLDNLFEERLAADDLLPLDDGRLLVETSYFNPPMDLHDILIRIKQSGYTPVLAHPERYIYMERREYAELKNMGIEFQLNVPSLSGLYGKHARQKAEWLRNRGLYDCMGTDVHNKYMVEKFLKK